MVNRLRGREAQGCYDRANVPLLDVILGYDCNLFCDYCTISPAMRARSLPTQRVLQALEQGRQSGYDAVSFTGGEPTIFPNLLGLVRRARALGYGDVKVQTNGLLFAHGPNLDRIADAGATRFHLSIHTHREDRYDDLVRRDGAYPLMVQGLRNLVQRKLAPTADVILKHDTYRDLPDAVAWLHGLGVRAVDLWFVSLTDHNRDNLESMPAMTEVVPTMRTAFAFGRDHGMTIRSLHVPRCLLGPDAGHAWDPVGDGVRVVTPDATFELTQSRLTGQIHVPACEGCAHRDVCAGIRPDYLERYGDAEIARSRGQQPQSPPTRGLRVIRQG